MESATLASSRSAVQAARAGRAARRSRGRCASACRRRRRPHRDLTIESCGQLPLHRPGRSSRSSCIAPPSLARAREGNDHDQRCQIPLIFPSRALRERGRAHHVSAAEFGDRCRRDPVAGCARPARSFHRRPEPDGLDEKPAAFVDRLDQAEDYLNERLAAGGECWQLDAKMRNILGLPTRSNSRNAARPN